MMLKTIDDYLEQWALWKVCGMVQNLKRKEEGEGFSAGFGSMCPDVDDAFCVRVDELIKQLPDKQREAIEKDQLIFGTTDKFKAKSMQVTLSYYRVLVSRAKKALRLQLKCLV